MIKKLIPKPFKKFAREKHQDHELKKSLGEFAALGENEKPSAALLQNLVYGWGNEGYSAEHEYLAELIERARALNAPILECGSGLSTLLLGIIAQKNNQTVWSLEHHAEWARRIKANLTKFAVNSVELCVAPLKKYDGFDWYDAPRKEMPKNFGLVICDGPPGATRGGRFGLLPVMQAHLPSGCVILADDADRPDEQKILKDWASELSTEFSMSGAEKPFATLIIP